MTEIYNTVCKCGKPISIEYEGYVTKRLTCSNCGAIITFTYDGSKIVVKFE